MPFFTRVPPTASAGGGVVADSEDVYWTVDLSAVAYGRGTYASHSKSFSEAAVSTRTSSQLNLTSGSFSAQTTTSLEQAGPSSGFRAGAPHIVAGSLSYTYPHGEHSGCPSALTCLQDSDERPGYTLRTIITCTILGSPEKRLTLRDIFLYVKAKYPFFKAQSKTFEVGTAPKCYLRACG